jgi:transcriptional regulator with XRE-family HTH domain
MFRSMSFRDRVREERRAQKLTQQQLAQRLEMSVSAIARWESVARAEPTKETAVKLADVLGVHYLWLVFGQGPRRKRAA